MRSKRSIVYDGLITNGTITEVELVRIIDGNNWYSEFALQIQIDQNKKLESQLQSKNETILKLVKALEFYEKESSVLAESVDPDSNPVTVYYNDYEFKLDQPILIGGKRARQTLKELKEVIEELRE